MKLIICLILLSFPIKVAYCQELKQVLRTSRFIKEEYEVLKSDRSIKYGSYSKIIKGTLTAKGNFKNNERVGIWEFYEFDSGELEQKYDFDSRRILYWSQRQQKPYNFYFNGKWDIGKLDSIPYLVGGLSDLKLEMYDKLFEYCYQYRNVQLPFAGVTVFSFIVKTDGSTKDHKISFSSKNAIEESLLKILSRYTNNWIPGIYNGQKVETEYNISMYLSYDWNSGTLEAIKVSFDQPGIK
jgi:hypothetical protein